MPHFAAPQAGVKAGSKLLLIGSGAAAVDAAKQGAAAAAAGAGWEEGKASEEPVHTQTQHAKVGWGGWGR